MNIIKKVLLIEQSLENRENFAELLELSGYSVFAVSTSEDGFRKAIIHQPDVIICNLIGLESCKHMDTHSLLNSIALTKDIPVIITTTNSTSEFKENCIKNGAKHVLLKPFPMEEIIEVVGENVLSMSIASVSAA